MGRTVTIKCPKTPCRMNRRKSAGLTLLELLVALTIFAFLGTAAYSGLNSLLNTRRMIETELQRLNELTRAQLLLERDILHLLDYETTDTWGERQRPFRGEAAQWQFVRGGWPTLPQSAATSDLRQVRWRQADGFLWRDVALIGAAAGQETAVLSGVTALRWRYLDADRQWQDEWLPTNANAPLLPLAVEWQLRLAEGVELTRLWLIDSPAVKPNKTGVP